jgi:glycosyltransferase involved in cell wall biosynthesis
MSDLRAPFYPVLHVDTGRTWGGGQQQVLYLHRGLLWRSIPSFLVCPKGSPLARKAAAEGLPVVEMKLGFPVRLVPAAKVVTLARRHGIRTLHMHTSPAHSIGLWVARLLGADIQKVVSRRVAFRRRANLFTRRKYLRRGLRYIAISGAVRKTLLQMGIPEQDVSIVHSGIGIARFSHADRHRARKIARELGIGDEVFVIGSVGSLVACKGHAVLIEALGRVAEEAPNLVCVIVGEGPERPNLESLIRRKGLEGKVLLTGQRDEVPEFLSLMDLFIMPSLQEGLGAALLEAMAAGKPVIASDVGGMPEVIAHGQNGMLVPPGKPEALAEAITGLIRDPLRRFALGAKGRQDVQNRFSSDAMVEGTIEVYRSLE